MQEGGVRRCARKGVWLCVSGVCVLSLVQGGGLAVCQGGLAVCQGGVWLVLSRGGAGCVPEGRGGVESCVGGSGCVPGEGGSGCVPQLLAMDLVNRQY